MLAIRFILAAVCVTSSIYSTSGQPCSTTNAIRLYNPNGNTTTEGGMLQICLSGIWTAACDYSFGCTDDGRAACKQLGYSGSQIKSFVMRNSAQYYGSWSYTDTYYYSCSTSSTSLTGCSKSSVSPSYLCNSDDQVGLWCMTQPQTVCTNGAIRLVGGASSNEGKLEYCHYGAWSSVCYNFHDEEATVACKQLGFSGSPKATVVTDGRFGHRWRFTSFQYLSCSSSGSQSSLASCSRYGSSSCGYRCTQNYGIICYEPGHDGCTEGSVRLVNSTIEYEGRVEVCVDGVWGTVCGVDAPDATTLCRVAGYSGVTKYFTTSKMFGDGDRPVLYYLRCNGCETSVNHCSKYTYPSVYCTRQSVAGVRCKHGCTDGDIRLTGGGSETEGTVEICHGQTWGMVSGLGWGEEDARVTCRQLQLSENDFKYFYDSPFGKPHHFTIFFSSVKCTGNEAQIIDCAKNNLTFEEGKKLVDHIGVAGVSCKRHCDALTASACPSVTTLAVISTQFVTKTIETRPSQQVQSASSSSTDSGHVTTTFLLAGISGTLATVTVTLAVCMCYLLYKNGKNKQSNSSAQGRQSENQYGRQPGDSNTNPVIVNHSYRKQLPATPSFDEDPPQTTYEAMSMCQ